MIKQINTERYGNIIDVSSELSFEQYFSLIQCVPVVSSLYLWYTKHFQCVSEHVYS